MISRFRRARPPDGAAASGATSGLLARAAVACALAIAVEGCDQRVDKEQLVNLACPTHAIRPCLEVAARADADKNRIADKQSPAMVKAGARCAEFMSTSPAPKPRSSPAISFWPNTTAGRYHENLLRKCGDLWALMHAHQSGQMHLRLARDSAREFFEHCLGSMSRRKLTEFETKLYCFDMYVTLNPLVDGHPREYWAYMVYRKAPEKDPARFPVIASAFCEKFRTREACDDVQQLDFKAETN